MTSDKLLKYLGKKTYCSNQNGVPPSDTATRELFTIKTQNCVESMLRTLTQTGVNKLSKGQHFR